MLSTFFSWSKKKDGDEGEPPIRFGRYSDNNKPVEKVERWNESDTLFKEKKYHRSIAAFFDYLRDETADNVQHEQINGKGTFSFYQGSKIVRGFYNDKVLEAEVALAAMPLPSVPVMRRLLEMNFTLYYSRFAINDNKLCMMFDSDIETANPSKLYYALKELSTKADKQDDLLVKDFTSLQPVDVDHIVEIPLYEKEVKFKYMQKWISETLALVSSVDADKYSGGIAYLLLALAYRLDFLLVPEGSLLLDLEKIVETYFKKEERSVPEKNAEMIEEFVKLQGRSKEEIFPNLFRSKHTFSIVSPQNHKTIADAIYNANQNLAWYRENKHPNIAAQISEYGIAYCQYSYSLPKPITEFFQLFMMVNYGDFFNELGFRANFYDREKKEFNKEEIIQTIEKIQAAWQVKYPEMKMKTESLKFDNLMLFNQSFSNEIEYLNLETK